MREIIGALKIGSHIMNLHIKRPRITINQRIGSRKRPFFNRIYPKLQIKRPHITRAACTRAGLGNFCSFASRAAVFENFRAGRTPFYKLLLSLALCHQIWPLTVHELRAERKASAGQIWSEGLTLHTPQLKVKVTI